MLDSPEQHQVQPTGTPAKVEPTGTPATAERWTPHALRLRFRHWRRTRPFWAGVWTLLGAVIITYGPATAFKVILVSGTAVWLGMLVGVVIGVLGLFLWFMPGLRHFFSVLIVLLALVSLITSDLGGFLIGMMLAIVGGALGFAWTDDPRYQERRRPIRTAARRLTHRRAEIDLREG